MNLYLIARIGTTGYDEYDSAVVAANTAKEAQHTHPSEYGSGWVHPDQVKVTYLGAAKTRLKAGVICASFNAG